MRVRVLRRDGGPGVWHTVNLSGSGLFVSGSPILPAGRELSIAVLIPGQIGPVIGRARVVWVNDPDGPDGDRRVCAGMGMELIELDAASRSLLHDALYGPRAPCALDASTDLDELDVGMVIGAYRIIDRLGRGGMGCVYLAEHIELGRRVALKRLHPKFADDRDAVRRFFDEGRVVNRVRHEHVVEITDFISEGSEKYYVMELLEGRVLSDLLKARARSPDPEPLPLHRAVFIAVQLCDALLAVHDVGIVHRDLKPANIFLLSRHGTADFVKLLDFGIAKQMGETPSLLSTQPGLVLGTPAYMAPELALGEEPDHRADLYAFGVLLYQLATGCLPFSARTWGEMMFEHVERRPPSPSSVSDVPLPPRLEKIILACLEKSPDDRPQSASEISAVLRDVLEEISPVEVLKELATPPTLRRRRTTTPTHVAAPEHLSTRRRGVLVAAALVVLLGASTSAWMLHQQSRAPASARASSRETVEPLPARVAVELERPSPAPAASAMVSVEERAGASRLVRRRPRPRKSGWRATLNPFAP